MTTFCSICCREVKQTVRKTRTLSDGYKMKLEVCKKCEKRFEEEEED